MCKNCTHCKINDNFHHYSGLCLKPHQRVTPSTQEKEFLFYLYLLWSYSSTRWSVTILLWSIALRHLTWLKKCDGFWLPGAKSFLTVYYMNDFAAIISGRYHTLNHFILSIVLVVFLKQSIYYRFFFNNSNRSFEVFKLTNNNMGKWNI